MEIVNTEIFMQNWFSIKSILVFGVTLKSITTEKFSLNVYIHIFYISYNFQNILIRVELFIQALQAYMYDIFDDD